MNHKAHSKYYTDENAVRLIAAQIVVLASVSLWTHWVLPLFVVVVDFGLRAFTVWPSPLAAIAKITADALKVKPRPVFAAPKKFAAATGFAFSTTALAFFLLHIYTAAYITAGVLVCCAMLEAAVKICPGCYVYDWLVAPVINRRNNKKYNTTEHD